MSCGVSYHIQHCDDKPCHVVGKSHVNVTPPTRVRTNSPSRSRNRDSGAGGGRSNKERQRLQPLASVARAPLLRSGEWGLHTALTGIHPLHKVQNRRICSERQWLSRIKNSCGTLTKCKRFLMCYMFPFNGTPLRRFWCFGECFAWYVRNVVRALR